MEKNIAALLEPLPYALKDQVRGYVSSAEAQVEEIFKSVGKETKVTSDEIGKFLFLVAVKRIWVIVDGFHWTLLNSIAILKEQGVNGLKMGGSNLTRDSDEYVRLVNFRNTFIETLNKNGLSLIIESKNISEIAEQIKSGKL